MSSVWSQTVIYFAAFWILAYSYYVVQCFTAWHRHRRLDWADSYGLINPNPHFHSHPSLVYPVVHALACPISLGKHSHMVTVVIRPRLEPATQAERSLAAAHE